MKKEKIKTTLEVFVCNHHRDGDEACFEKGAKNLTDNLKKWAKNEYKSDIKVYRSGCLSKCSEGIAIACFPGKEMLLEVKESDEKEIKKGLKEALEKLRE